MNGSIQEAKQILLFLSSDFIKGMCWFRSDVAPDFRHLRSELCSFSFVWTTWLRLPRILCNCFLSERQKARDGVQKECGYTSRAAAAIMTMAVTCLAGLRGGTAVRTWTATFQEHHVVWTFLVCGQKFFNVNQRILQSIRKKHCLWWRPRTVNVAPLQQNVSFLHSWGLPPAWMHCLENSESVLQRTKVVLSVELHVSTIQALLKDSTSRMFWQSTKGSLEKVWSQNCWKRSQSVKKIHTANYF